MLLAIVRGAGAVVPGPSTKFNVEVANLQVFDSTLEKILEFIMVCKLFLRMRMSDVTVEEQIQ